MVDIESPAGFLPSKLTSLACGLSKYPIERFLFSYLFAFLPYQLIYLYLSVNVDPIRSFFKNIGLNISLAYIFSIVSTCAFGFLLISIIRKIFRRFYINKLF